MHAKSCRLATIPPSAPGRRSGLTPPWGGDEERDCFVVAARAKTYAELVKQGRIGDVIADPSKASAFDRAMAASEGKALINNLGNAGVFNQFTGSQELNDVGKSAAMENRARRERLPVPRYTGRRFRRFSLGST